jgi:thioredoxin reductase
MLVRSEGLAESVSRYLIRRIEESQTIVVHPHTVIDALEGDAHLERVRWRDTQSGLVETNDVQHVFVMMGAVPNTPAALRSMDEDLSRPGPIFRATIWPEPIGHLRALRIC